MTPALWTAIRDALSDFDSEIAGAFTTARQKLRDRLQAVALAEEQQAEKQAEPAKGST